jgi:phage shock protein A
VAQLEDQQERLVQNEKELSARIESFRSQKEVMKAQYSAAEAQVRINEAATGLGGKMSDAGAAIERAKTKTEEMQARAAATDELIESGTLEDFTSDRTQLDRELAQMASQSQVESELAQLKQEIGPGSGGEQKQIEGGDGDENVSQIHAVPADETAEGKQA